MPSSDAVPTRVRHATHAGADVLADAIPGTWEVLRIGADPAAGVPERVCVLDPGLTSLGWPAFGPTLATALARPNLLTFLIAAEPPPAGTGRSGGAVLSFVGPARLLSGVDAPVEQLCYSALEPLLSGRPPHGIGVVARECPPPADALPEWRPTATDRRAVVVMAHRGSSDHLRACLAAVANLRPGPAVVRIGLDGHLPADLDDFAAAGAEFYADPAAGRVGPYAIRHHLVTAAREPVVVFHDSDDISTADRLHWLLAGQADRGGLVGSYEIRYDPESREMWTQRFPLDVTAALRAEARHPLLHPTSAIATHDFRQTGGFATDCIFGNDTQFLLRASLHLPVANVPRFLYVRREHPDSLTSHPDTGMGNPLRTERNLRWRADYASVLAGSLSLADSSLGARPGPVWRGSRVEFSNRKGDP